MATRGQKELNWNLVKDGVVTLKIDEYPWYNSIVVCKDKIVVIDRHAWKVQLFRLHDGKLLATTGRLEPLPRDLCLMDAMTICVLHCYGLIKMVSIDCTDMSRVLKTTRELRLQGAMDDYHGVVRFKDNLVVCGVKQDIMIWCVVSLHDGHVDTIHQICKRDGEWWCRVTTKDNIVYVACCAGGDNTGVYGFDILNPSKCKYKYKHQRLQWPSSIVINEDGNIFVCNGVLDSCIHQLTASCQLVAIFTQGIPLNPHAMFWDNGRLYVTCYESRDITVFTHLYQDHEVHEVQQSNEGKQPVREEIATQTEQEAGYRLEEDLTSLTLEDNPAKQKEIPVVWNFTAKDILETWQSIEYYLLEELAPVNILSFFENESILSAKDRKDICKLTRRKMAKEVLQKIKANLPEAFLSFLRALNEAKQDFVVNGLRQHIDHHETNVVVDSIAYYTLKIEFLKEGKVLHETESKTKAYLEEGSIVFDYEMRSQCLKWEAGSVIIYLRPLSKSTKETLECFCENGGIKDFVLDLLKKNDIFSSLPEGEMSIQVQVHSYNQDSESEGADELYKDYTQMIDKHSLSQLGSFTVTDDPCVIKENLRKHLCLLVEEIEPLHIIGTFEERGVWDKRLFEELKMIKERKKRATHFLRQVVNGGNRALATLVHALRENNYGYLADSLCITAKTSSQDRDKGQVESGLIEVLQDDSSTHTHESMIWSCSLVVEVRKDKEEGQKRKFKDDQDGPSSKKILSKSKGTPETTSTDSVMATKYTEAKRRHNLLCRMLNGIITKNPLTDIKRMARTYLDRTTLEKVESMDDLLSALEVKGEIALGNYDVLIQIMTDADVRIGVDEIHKAAEDIKYILDT